MNITTNLLDPLTKRKIKATREGQGYMRTLPSPITKNRNRVRDKRLHPKAFK